MFNKVNNILKNKDLVINNLLFYNFSKLNINYEELYYLIYLINCSSNDFDIVKISSEMNAKPKDILKVINSLDEKDIIDIEVLKNNDTDIKEIISLDKLYKKLTFLIVEEKDKQENKIDLVKEFESVFKRDLIGREKRIINAWKSVGYPDDFVLEGLKEAKYNGQFSFSYIDNILDGWIKIGITTKEDVINAKTINNKSSIERDQPEIDICEDYDWMNE